MRLFGLLRLGWEVHLLQEGLEAGVGAEGVEGEVDERCAS